MSVPYPESDCGRAFPSTAFGVWDWREKNGSEPIIPVLSAQPCLATRSASARAWDPQRAKAGRGSPSGPGRKGLGGRAKPRLRRAGSLAGSYTPTPGRAGVGRTDQQTNGVARSRLHACAALPTFPPVLPVDSPARDAPRHSAPLALAQGLVM